MLGRQLYQRCPGPLAVLGLAPSGVEIAASAAEAMRCQFDVIIAAHVRLDNVGIIGAMAESTEAVLDPGFQPKFGLMEPLNEAMDKARRAIKTERLLFRGQRELRKVKGMNVVVMDGQVTSVWKLIAAVRAAEDMGARKVWAAAAVSTQSVQEQVRNRRIDFVCPSVLMDPSGHPQPFGESQDPSAERLRSIVVARQAA